MAVSKKSIQIGIALLTAGTVAIGVPLALAAGDQSTAKVVESDAAAQFGELPVGEIDDTRKAGGDAASEGCTPTPSASDTPAVVAQPQRDDDGRTNDDNQTSDDAAADAARAKAAQRAAEAADREARESVAANRAAARAERDRIRAQLRAYLEAMRRDGRDDRRGRGRHNRDMQRVAYAEDTDCTERAADTAIADESGNIADDEGDDLPEVVTGGSDGAAGDPGGDATPAAPEEQPTVGGGSSGGSDYGSYGSYDY